MDAFTRITSPGTTDAGRLFVTVRFDGRRLSITGVEGPRPNGDCRGGCGQVGIPDSIRLRDGEGWDLKMVEQLRAVWDEWHLNDMRAGCVHQRAAKWDPQTSVGKPCPECGYRYGWAWLFEEVPADVLEFLRGLPDASEDLPAAWRRP